MIMLKALLVGADGRAIQTTASGALAIGSVGQVQMHSVKLDVNDTVYNLLKPVAGMQPVITTVAFSGNRGIGVNDAVVQLYEASSATASTIDATLIQVEVAKNQLIPFADLNLAVSSGKFLNAKADDTDVFVVFGVYFQEDIGDADFHRRTKTGIGNDVI